MDLLDNKGRRLRGTSLPWNTNQTPSRPNGFDQLSTKERTIRNHHLQQENNVKKSQPVASFKGINDGTASTYMVINFEKDFKADKDDPEMPADMPRVDRRKTAEAIDKYKQKSDSGSSRLPMLQSTFSLPMKMDEKGGRNMFRRADGSTQTPLDMTKHNFQGLSDYTEWCSKEVEPFLKDLRKAIKDQRPKDINAYIVRYCQAVAIGDPPPETQDPLPEVTLPDDTYTRMFMKLSNK